MADRIETLRKNITELGYDAYLTHEEMNVCYLTGIPNPQEQILLVNADGNDILYTLSDGLRTATLKVGDKCEIKAADIGQPSLDILLADIPAMNLDQIGFDNLSAGAYLISG